MKNKKTEHQWCARGDLNPHAIKLATGPKPVASTNSATRAGICVSGFFAYLALDTEESCRPRQKTKQSVIICQAACAFADAQPTDGNYCAPSAKPRITAARTAGQGAEFSCLCVCLRLADSNLTPLHRTLVYCASATACPDCCV